MIARITKAQVCVIRPSRAVINQSCSGSYRENVSQPSVFSVRILALYSILTGVIFSRFGPCAWVMIKIHELCWYNVCRIEYF